MNCQKYGRQHKPCQCPTYRAVCHKCGKNNHLSKVCRTVGEKRDNFKAKTVNNIESEVDSLYIGMICNNGKKAASLAKVSKWFETASIRGIAIKFKLDSGVDASVLPMSIKQLPGQLRPTKTVLITFGGACLPSSGVASLQCKTARYTAAIEFHVARQADKAILG